MTKAHKIEPPEPDDESLDVDDDEVIDVESEETLETPNLPAIPLGGRVEVRYEPRRLDALRLGDEVNDPFDGIVTGVRMRANSTVLVLYNGDIEYIGHMSEAVLAKVPSWRPGDLLGDDHGALARSVVFQRELAESTS